jgi:hypothetical protein
MIGLTLTIILLFTSNVANAENATVKAIKKNCAEKWETDYRMQKYCQKKQYEAADKINSLAKKYPDGTEESNIIYRCGEKWRWGDTFNFTMVLYCSKKQIEAYHQVK